MKRFLSRSFLSICMIFSLVLTANSAAPKKENLSIILPTKAGVRIKHGAEELQKGLNKIGYQTKIVYSGKLAKGRFIQVSSEKSTGKESYNIKTDKRGNITISGGDDTGILYGFIALKEKVEKEKSLSRNINIEDKPEMVLRGTAIGIQKPDYLPGRDVYEYPYTPESFPWFYDKQHWIEYLDMLLENRYNSLYLWNGHPFSSLVKLKDYPYALEVSEETFKKNEEIFKFLATEADKRGIWVIQMFYNILIPKPFADKHGLKTQDRNRPITPLIADYTQKSIAAFVEKYPNVGLLVTLGEAMEGVGQDDIDWFIKTIIPGVKDGLKAIGATQEPPIVLRAHDTDAPAVMKAALPIYKNLYTMAKYNGEALTTYTTRGKWAELHRNLAAIGTVHIQNVHILANLEPFRYSSPDFIQKSVHAMHNIHHSNGLHLYPQASYWDWPFTADKVGEKRLSQIERDWMWYKTWARYAWKVDRDRNEEIKYWSEELAEKFGTSTNQAKHILDAYEEMGEISPKILRRFGITDGNRQTSTLGMLMTQLINPFRYGLFTLMYESEAPEGEMIIEYAEKEWKKEPHIGETPVQIAQEIVVHGRKAVEAIEKATSVTKDNEEFQRLKNDVYAHNAMANFYSDKVKAAMHILRFKYSDDVADLEKALPLLESSVEHYRKLAELTKDTYWYANSMQTKQRKIPMRGVDMTFKHWTEVLPVFETELANFKHSIDSLKKNTKSVKAQVNTYKNLPVKLESKNLNYYTLDVDAIAFSDQSFKIEALSPELKGLRALQFSSEQQKAAGSNITFTSAKPVTVLVGFFNSKDIEYSPAPVLEIDASANNYGQAESKISNGILINGMPVNVHAYTFPAGKNTLTLARGKALVLGFIDAKEKVKIHDAGLNGSGRDIDWLFGEYAPTDVKL